MLVNGLHTSSTSINDRGLSYGDGLFETIRLHNGQALFLQLHLDRLIEGCQRLGLHCVTDLIAQDIEQLSSHLKDHDVLKIIITREADGRGYRANPQASVNRIVSLHNLPNKSEALSRIGIPIFLCQQRLGTQPSLAGIKHLNRLEQVLASQEWPSEAFEEGLMQDLAGNIIEGTKTNVFIVEAEQLITPMLNNCGVAGVMRKAIMDILPVREEEIPLERLLSAEAVFVCNSVFGVWPVRSLQMGGEIQEFQTHVLTQQSQQVFIQALAQDEN